MKKLLLISSLLMSMTVNAADYTIEFQPGANTVGNPEVSSITSSKVSDFINSVSSMISSVVSNYVLKTDIKHPTVQTFLSGTNVLYTTPAGVKWIEVEMVAGGGGGGGAYSDGDAGINSSYGPAGENSSFGGTLLVAEGGGKGGVAPDPVSKCTINSPAVKLKAFSGTRGGLSNYGGSWNYSSGGTGGSSPLGGAGPASGFNKGQDALPNTGSGGGGGGANAMPNVYSGSGGFSGCYMVVQINNPSPNYSVTVGLGGNAGIGTGPVNGQGVKSNKFDGGKGASGIVIVREYYQ